MQSRYYKEIKPGRKPWKLFLVKMILFLLGRVAPSVARMEEEVQKEIDRWEEGFKVMLAVPPRGPYLTLSKKDGKLKCLGMDRTDADLIINFKNLDSAFLMLTTQISTTEAYAQHRLSVKGDVATGMSFTRCLNLIQFILFPKFVSRRVLKRLPEMTLRRWLIRLYAYLVTIPLGI